jgi:nitrite reductase (cytochrome c-552)
MKKTYIIAFAAAGAATAALALLVVNISQRKQEARRTYVEVVRLTEDTVDPAVWGRNFPSEYEGFRATQQTRRTKYGGSEPYSHLEHDPRLKRFFAGYAFALDYREDRGHWWSLADQDSSERTKQRPQPGSCLQCHASILPAYRKLGFETVSAMPLREARKLVDHGISCLECHDPQTMALRVTRPAFLRGIRALRNDPAYDPNATASRQEMRTYVCAQCHVEYYFAGEHKLVAYPWNKGLKVEQIEAYYDEIGFSDWNGLLKAQHPEFETWSQGIHARAGVTCADCHMPYVRQGAVKISDHHVRSPLVEPERACAVCHPAGGAEMKARAEAIQDRHAALLSRAEDALIALYDSIDAARKAGASEQALAAALRLRRRAQWRLDFVNAENSMGFHAPQESARILGEAIDFARQGQLSIGGTSLAQSALLQ